MVQTCRAISDVALDRLWEEVDPVFLLSVLGPMVLCNEEWVSGLVS